MTTEAKQAAIARWQKATEAKQAAIARWQKKNTKTFCLRFNLEADADVIDILETVENKCDFVRDLIRATARGQITAGTPEN